MKKITINCKPVKGLHRMIRIMKLCILFLVLGLNLSWAGQTYSQNTQLSLDVKNKSLKEVFRTIEQQSEFIFFYNNDAVDFTRKVNISAKGKSLNEVLDILLAGSTTEYRISDRQVVLYKKDNTRTPDNLQKLNKPEEIQVKVVDKDKQPLTGVSVSVKGTTKGGITDAEGAFRITAQEGASLVFSYMGYITQEVKLSGQKELLIRLQEDTKTIDEIVVVGYGIQKKETLTGSISVINMKEKENQTITHATQALYSTPGLWINQAGAKPGKDAATIRIRGVNTLSSNNPLVLLDGIEYSFDEIDPNDIESISVLKDASAAIYGSKSSNGVILITSKKARKGKPKIEYRGNFGVQQATYLPDVVDDPILYMNMRNQAEMNSGIEPGAVSYSAAHIKEYEEGMLIDPGIYPSSNWFDICMQNGFIQQHNLRATGGSDAVSYTIGVGYTNQTGVLIANDDAQRYSFDMKLSAELSPKLKVTGSLLGNVRKFNEVGYGVNTVMQVIMRGLPIMSDYHENNLYGSTWLYTPGRNNIENPRMEVEQGFTKRDYQEFLSSININYRLPLDFTYDGTFGYRKIDHWSKDFIPQMWTIHPKTGDVRAFNSSVPRVKDWDAYNARYTISQRLIWNKNLLEKHNVSLMLGQEYQVYDNRNFQAYKQGFIDNSLYDLNASADDTFSKSSGGSSKEYLASFYGRMLYSFQDKYLLDATFRYDGSSRFLPANAWSFFPSLSLGWRIDQENFFHSDFIDILKLRASVGKLGNQAVSPNSYLATVEVDKSYNYSFGSNEVSGAAVSSLTYKQLRWESTMAYNLGVDVNAFGNKLVFTGELFYKRTNDILRKVGIPAQVGGLAGPTMNVGVVDNKGYEIAANYRGSIQRVSYGVQASMSYVRNEVIDIRGEEMISGRYITKEGYPINSYYLYDAIGYYQSQEEINSSVVYGTRSKLRPGYIKYANHEEDGEINEKDKIVTGSTIPDYNFSFGFNLGYRGFTLDTQLQGVAGVNVYPTANLAFPFNNGAGVTKEWINDSWTESNPNAKYPLLTTATNAPENFINSTHWLRDASYLRVKNIQLSYTCPDAFVQKLKIERAMLYISGQNLWTLSDFKTADPEMTITKGDLYEYPSLKTVSIGLNLTF